MGAKKDRIVAGSHKEGVLHVAGRVLRREVQCLENVVVILDFRTFCDIVAEFAEDFHNLLSRDGHRMAGPESYRVSGKSTVERWCGCGLL